MIKYFWKIKMCIYTKPIPFEKGRSYLNFGRQFFQYNYKIIIYIIITVLHKHLVYIINTKYKVHLKLGNLFIMFFYENFCFDYFDLFTFFVFQVIIYTKIDIAIKFSVNPKKN